MTVQTDIEELAPRLIALRRALHLEPEIGLSLPGTRARVLAQLDELPLEITTRDDDGSVVAVLRGTVEGADRRSVILRADMDALPVHELTGLPYAAPGDAMHACGHDLHTAILVGAAHLLSRRRSELAGDVVFMFQPGEEGYDGARRMIDAGVLDASGSRAIAAYALHVTSSRYGNGVVATRPGALMAASDVLKVVVHGRGGHASAPHETLDPIPVAAEIVLALQTLMTRHIDAFEPVVLTVGRFRAGSQNNIIPDTADFDAAVRTFSAATRSDLIRAATTLCESVAAAHGLRADVEWETLYPVTVNDESEAAFLEETARQLFGDTKVARMPYPVTGSEDFSRVLQDIPGAMAFLGATPAEADPDEVPFNHSAHAIFDDSVIPAGATLLAQLASRRLESLGS
jgi:amidohydrolase